MPPVCQRLINSCAVSVRTAGDASRHVSTKASAVRASLARLMPNVGGPNHAHARAYTHAYRRTEIIVKSSGDLPRTSKLQDLINTRFRKMG
ncbi:hypothetical protein EVAR_103124_1 [Eumeta japonica]|uniref:Uncharacterized protein n=1 Tax=Eumeta variegata TaxID=151549 RepID=A0A4C1X1B2_EUMVA|nr:hypothetical protein EVAR_103124_1 [Eumeta japonica]